MPTLQRIRAGAISAMVFLFPAYASPAFAGQSWNFASDFNIVDPNPHGVWSYGLSSDNPTSSPVTLFTQTSTNIVSDSNGSHTLVAWYNSLTPGTVDSYMQKNVGSTDMYGDTAETGGQVLPAGQVKLRAGDAKDWAVVIFTAPAAGDYQINAKFDGMDWKDVFAGTWTDVEILQNTSVLFSDGIRGFPGYPAVHDFSIGSSAELSYSSVRTLAQGDHLLFAVGNWDGYITNASTGADTQLALTITQVPEPSSVALIVGASIMLLRRRSSRVST